MQNIKGIASYKIKEHNYNDERNYGPFLDLRTMYQIYPKLVSSENIYEMLDKMERMRPDFIGEKSDIFDLFNKRITKKDTKKSDIVVHVELPEQENYIEVRNVTLEGENTILGRYGTKFTMAVASGNLTVKNFYGLIDYPEIMFRPVTNGRPAGTYGFEYDFVVHGGQYEDYIEWGRKLKQGSRFQNMGAYAEEAIKVRGSVEIGLPGKAFVVYKYPMTNMAFETFVTDKAWQAGTHFVVTPQAGSPEEIMNVGQITISEYDAKFKVGCDLVFDRYIMAGKGFVPGQNNIVDAITHNPAAGYLGPSFLDFLRASSSETYIKERFNLEYFLDRVKRKITKLKNADRSGMVIDIITGDGGWTYLTPELNRLDKQAVLDPDYVYGNTAALDSNRKGVILNKKQVRGVYLDDYGTVIFHNSDVLNKGILSGQRDYKGYKLSSYWFIIVMSKPNIQEGKNNAVYLYENSTMEQFGAIPGTFSPSGPTLKTSTNYKVTDSSLGNQYKIICDLAKGFYIPDFNSIQILYPNIEID